VLTVCAPVRQGELRVVRAVYGVCGKVIQPRAVFGAVEQVQAVAPCQVRPQVTVLVRHHFPQVHIIKPFAHGQLGDGVVDKLQMLPFQLRFLLAVFLCRWSDALHRMMGVSGKRTRNLSSNSP